MRILTMLESTPFIMCSTTRTSTQHLCEIPYDIYLSPIIIVYTDANYSACAFWANCLISSQENSTARIACTKHCKHAQLNCVVHTGGTHPPSPFSYKANWLKVSICLIFMRWRFSVQFTTPRSHFTPSESNGLGHLQLIFGLKLKQKGAGYTQVFMVIEITSN